MAESIGGDMPDRFGEGYSAARAYYERRAANVRAITAEWSAPSDPLGEKGRAAIRKAWPSLASALDNLTEQQAAAASRMKETR